MRVFWNERGRGPTSDKAETVDLEQALHVWSDEMRGVEGNFFGLIDDQDRTIQFYFVSGIPDHVDDASHEEIVELDFPVVERRGSLSRMVTIGECDALIRKAFQVGAEPNQFEPLTFSAW